MNIPESIDALVEGSLGRLSAQLQAWVRGHRVKPYRVRLTPKAGGGAEEEFWIVTDQTGKDDSAQRVVFNPRSRSFGVEMTLETGRKWYLGDSGSFDKAVMDM